MNWILIAAAAYLIMAVSQLIDKGFLNIVFREAKAYATLVGFLSIIAFVLLPFGISTPSSMMLGLCILGGALFIFALWPFLTALQGDDASRIIPLLGASIPVFTLLGESLFLKAQLQPASYVAFALLIAGGFILTMSRSESGKRSTSAILLAIFAAILFAISFVISKQVFQEIGFINGFFWMRMGGILAAIILLMFPDTRADLKSFFSKQLLPVKFGYFGNQILAGGGFFLQSYAISMASVSLVSALQGIQYIFVLFFVALVSRFKPGLLQEKITVSVLVEKLTAVLIIVAGIALLSLSR